MTPEQERTLRIEAARRGYDKPKVEAFVQFAKSQEQSPAPTPATASPKRNIIKDIAADIVKPFARAGTSVFNEAAGIAQGVKIFTKEGLAGDYTKASRTLDASRNLPIAGRVEPLNDIKEGMGAGAEIASWFVGGQGGAKAAVSLGKSTFAQVVMKSAKTGAAVGGLAAGGRSAQEGGNAVDIAGSTLKGAAIGYIAGGVIGGGVSAVPKMVQGAAKGIQNAQERLTADDSLVSRVARRIENSVAKRAELKAQPIAVQRAAKVDISPETAHFILDASPVDKGAFRNMLDVAENAKKTLRPGQRPVEIPGRTIIERVKFVNTVRKSAGQELGEVVKTMPKTRFTPENTVNEFRKGLTENLGVTIKPGGRLDFSKSAVTGADEQRMLQRIANDLGISKLNPQITRDIAHKTRQRIFNMLDLGKQQGQLSSYSEVLANKTREALKADIVANSGKAGQNYAELSAKYAQTQGVLDDFYKLIGKKFSDKSDDILALRAGEVGNRILGNASANPLDVIGRLETAATKNGFKATNNPIDQLIFNDILEDLLGSTQTRSLRGQVSRGVRDAAANVEGMATDAVTGNVPGILKKAVDFARGVTPEEQLRALRQLLR